MASFFIFDIRKCFGSRSDDDEMPQRRTNGVEREMRILYQQPHLVEPMKLRLYDELPFMASPKASSPAQLSPLSQTRKLRSRASTRTNLFAMRRKSSTQSVAISQPMLVDASSGLALRRRREFRPLELSIYAEENRLSDLPDFDRLSITSTGEVKLPPKVVRRTQSDVFRPLLLYTPASATPKTLSMFEVPTSTVSRPGTTSSIVSTSRPPSQYEALQSHPVSWAEVTGAPLSTKTRKNSISVDILTPMQEEFNHETTSVTVNGTILRFPDTDPLATYQESPTASLPLSEMPAPGPTISRGPSRPISHSFSLRHSATQHNQNVQAHMSIGQWLHYRNNSGSTSTVDSDSTTKSLAVSRRKRAQFYSLRVDPIMSPPSPPQLASTRPATVVAAVAGMQDRDDSPQNRYHHRTVTVSSVASTVDTDVLSLGRRRSEDTIATLCEARTPKSRTGTMKSASFAFPAGVLSKELAPVETDKTSSSSPSVGRKWPLSMYQDSVRVEILDDEKMYLDDIRGPLRTADVGIAF